MWERGKEGGKEGGKGEREREMAIGGLIQGYRRWNPVHPMYGAFWGVGLGARL
jgi:hypothetical protein